MEQQELEKIDAMSAEELDSLPLGAIKLDPSGVILSYNATEGRLANYDPMRAIGKNFFTEVAPCTRVEAFYGEFIRGIARKQLHTTFPYRFLLVGRPPVDVTITLFYSHTNAVWVMVQRYNPRPGQR
jgi:photoactive yellow protein